MLPHLTLIFCLSPCTEVEPKRVAEISQKRHILAAPAILCFVSQQKRWKKARQGGKGHGLRRIAAHG